MVGPLLISSQKIDLFPVATSFELGYNGKEVRSTWDCYELEIVFLPSLPVKVAAKGRRKKKKRLGYICDKLDLILIGLGLQPNGKRARVGKLGLDLIGSDFGLVSGLVSRSVSGPAPGLGDAFNPYLGPFFSASDLVFSVFGFVAASGPALFLLVSLGAAGVGSGSSLPVASDLEDGFWVCNAGGSPCLFDSTHLGFGLSKLQIWLLEWIKDQLSMKRLRTKIIWCS